MDLGAFRKCSFFAPFGRLLQTCVFSALLAFLNNFYQSYSTFYTNTAAESIQQFLNVSYTSRGRSLGERELLWLWSVFLTSAFFGSILSTLFAPFLCEKAGRRATLLYSNCGVFLASLLAMFSVLFLVPELFLLSRILGAALSNLNFCALALFIMEFPATNYRGLVAFLAGLSYGVGTNLGILLGMDALLGRSLVALTGVALLPAFLAILSSVFLKETPKFLLLKRNNKKAALDSLRFYQGEKISHEQVLLDLQKERQQNDLLPLPQLLRELFLKRHLILASALSFSALQLTVGPWTVTTTLLADHFGMQRAQLFSVLCAVTSLCFNVPGALMAERVSRRSMLLYSGLTNASCLVFYALFDQLSILWQPFRFGCVATIFAYFSTFGIALGTIPFYIAGELFPQNFRSLGQSLVFFCFSCSSFLFNLLILPAYAAIGVWAFLPLFTVPQAFCLVILWFFLPETRGREVHEIVEDLKAPTIWRRKIRTGAEGEWDIAKKEGEEELKQQVDCQKTEKSFARQ